MYRDNHIGDRTVAALREHVGEAHLLEIVMLAGQYPVPTGVYDVRPFGVQLEPDVLSRAAP